MQINSKQKVWNAITRIAWVNILISMTLQSEPNSPPVSPQDIKRIMQASKQLKLDRRKVGIRLQHVNWRMAEIIDANAEFDTLSVREAEQEISDRVRLAIEKFEEKHDVCVVMYHESKKGLENVTSIFIKETFPYADTNIKQDAKQQQSKPEAGKDKQIVRFN